MASGRGEPGEDLVELFDRARGWKAGKKDFLVGLDLADALEWDGKRNRSRKWGEHYAGAGAIEAVEDYLAASRKNFQESEGRRLAAARRTRRLAYALAVLLIAALVLAFLALRATGRARQQQKLAESREFAAKSESLDSAGNRSDALTTAMRAFSIEHTLEAGEAVARALPQALTSLEGHSARVVSAAFSPDGQRVLTASDDKTCAGVPHSHRGRYRPPLCLQMNCTRYS